MIWHCVGGASARLFSTLLTVVTSIFAVPMTRSFADTIDATTSCSFAIQAFDSEKRAGQVLAGAPSPHVQEVGDYIMGVMQELDSQYVKNGKSGILIWVPDLSTRRHCPRRGAGTSSATVH
jgi:hypothetical protein